MVIQCQNTQSFQTAHPALTGELGKRTTEGNTVIFDRNCELYEKLLGNFLIRGEKIISNYIYDTLVLKYPKKDWLKCHILFGEQVEKSPQFSIKWSVVAVFFK